MPTSTLVLVKNKTIQKQIQKAHMTVIVSLHPVITFHIDYNLRISHNTTQAVNYTYVTVDLS